jgi:hypothetical protein
MRNAQSGLRSVGRVWLGGWERCVGSRGADLHSAGGVGGYLLEKRNQAIRECVCLCVFVVQACVNEAIDTLLAGEAKQASAAAAQQQQQAAAAAGGPSSPVLVAIVVPIAVVAGDSWLLFGISDTAPSGCGVCLVCVEAALSSLCVQLLPSRPSARTDLQGAVHVPACATQQISSHTVAVSPRRAAHCSRSRPVGPVCTPPAPAAAAQQSLNEQQVAARVFRTGGRCQQQASSRRDAQQQQQGARGH